MRWLVLVRALPGLTQEQMARELKCSLSTVTRLERLSQIPHNEAVKDNFFGLARQAKIEVS